MDIRALLTDERAVSPVIGVILMVAITVILAAVIAAFVLGFGATQSNPPTVTFDYEVDGDELVIRHVSGDDFFSDRIEFQGDGLGSDVSGSTWTDQKAGLSSDTRITAGERVRVPIDTDDFELEVIWNTEDGEESSTISETSGPVPENPSP